MHAIRTATGCLLTLNEVIEQPVLAFFGYPEQEIDMPRRQRALLSLLLRTNQVYLPQSKVRTY